MNSGTAQQKGDRQAQEEALFQSLLKRLPTVTDKSQLLEVTLLALQLMLRRPGDKPLLSELMAEAREAVASVPTEVAANERQKAMRQAVGKAIEVLKAAKKRRQSRSSEKPAAQPQAHPHHAPTHHAHHAQHHKTHHVHHQAPLEWWESGWTWFTAAAVLLAIAGIVYAIFSYREGDGPPGAELANQMLNASSGRAPATHVFGGRLTMEGRDGEVTVTAERVPPTKCVSAAWELSKKGLVSINGFQLTKVTASKISEYCHADPSGAALAWSSKGSR